MEYIFLEKESKIYDFILFPQAIYFTRELEKIDKKNDNYIDVVPESLKNLYLEIEEKLMPYSEEIESLYFSDFNIWDLISKNFSIVHYSSYNSFFSMLKNLENDELKKILFLSLYSIRETKDFNKVSISDIQFLLDNDLSHFDFINSLSIDNSDKWKITNIIRNPAKTIDNWINLLEKLKDLFNYYYKQSRPRIISYGNSLVERLNKHNGENLSSITCGILDKSVLPSGNICISFINQCNISLFNLKNNSYSTFGLEVENMLNLALKAEEGHLAELITTFKNLGDTTRYKVLKNISNGITSTKDIANSLGVSSATVSYHINQLNTSKILKLERVNGKYINSVNIEWINNCISKLKKDLKL